MSEDVYRAVPQLAAPGNVPVLEGRMMPYGEWTEINSSVEGHFLERFVPGALAKTIRERKGKIRALFEHGLDLILGRQVIADIDEMREEPDGAYYRATLLDGVPNLIVSGLRRGLYGSSIRFKVLQADSVRRPGKSEHNPQGLEERTIREARLMEFSVVAFPAYAGATAHVRSLTDEVTTRKLVSSLVTPESGALLELSADPARMAALRQLYERTREPARRPTRDYLADPPARRPTRDWLTPAWRL